MQDELTDLFQPDTLLSREYWDGYRSKTSLAPEKMLMLAVLEDSIDCIRKHARAPQSLAFREEVSWLLERTADHLYSFENVCAVLELDANCIREALLDWTGKKATRMPRSKRSFVPKKAPRDRTVPMLAMR
jgi:hypothetical protein